MTEVHDMELGNLAFGHSRGKYAVDRSLKSLFWELLTKLGVDDGLPAFTPKGWKDAPVFGLTNGTFTVRPYYWGDCTCGWDEKEFAEGHDGDCYQSILDLLRQRYGHQESWGWYVPYDHPDYSRERDALCRSMGLDETCGSEVHCTCTYRKRLAAWVEANKLGPEGHAELCPTVLPNFVHHPSGFSLRWYKYPLRDSYSSEPLAEEMIRGWLAWWV